MINKEGMIIFMAIELDENDEIPEPFLLDKKLDPKIGTPSDKPQADGKKELPKLNDLSIESSAK